MFRDSWAGTKIRFVKLRRRDPLSPPSRSKWPFVVAIIVASIFAACRSCGGSDDTDAGAPDAGPDGGPGDGGDGGGGSCNPACDVSHFCSSANTCLTPGQCASTFDCDAGYFCAPDAGLTCQIGSSCGSSNITGVRVVPNLLVALDRSCSMTDILDGGVRAGISKWSAVVSALNDIATTYSGQIRFGLTLFPEHLTAGAGPQCTENATPLIEVSDDGGQAMVNSERQSGCGKSLLSRRPLRHQYRYGHRAGSRIKCFAIQRVPATCFWPRMASSRVAAPEAATQGRRTLSRRCA